MADAACAREAPGHPSPALDAGPDITRARLTSDLAWLVTAASRAGLGETSQPARFALDGLQAALSLPGGRPWDLQEVRDALETALAPARPARLSRPGPGQAADGHWPVLASVPALGVVTGCECGKRPRGRPQRASAQHAWHQVHRRRLRLPPAEYAWPDEAADQARDGGTVPSTGGYAQARSHS